MLISYDHEFIFIHVYKVAGVSIKNALQKYSHDPSKLLINRSQRKLGINSNLPYYKYKTFSPHINARLLRKELPKKVYNNFYKFAFVRNPWDWQVSLYSFMLKSKSHRQHEIIKSMRSFDDYLKWRVNGNKRFQKDFVTDDDGNLIVDFVGKFESIEEDFKYICKNLKINDSLPHMNKSPHKDYRAYYNCKTKKIIEDHFKEDIEFFGYKFDS